MANPGTPVITVVEYLAGGGPCKHSSNRCCDGKSGTGRHDDSTRSKDAIEGKVTVVSPAADPNTTTVQVWIEVPNPGERLKPGTAVHARIATEVYKAATAVPVVAILPGEEGGTSVLTVSSDSVVHRRLVTLGVREGKQVQVLTGVAPGEEVVVVGGMGLDDRTKVKIVTTAVEESGDEDEDNAPEPGGKEKGAAKPTPAKQ